MQRPEGSATGVRGACALLDDQIATLVQTFVDVSAELSEDPNDKELLGLREAGLLQLDLLLRVRQPLRYPASSPSRLRAMTNLWISEVPS